MTQKPQEIGLIRTAVVLLQFRAEVLGNHPVPPVCY